MSKTDTLTDERTITLTMVRGSFLQLKNPTASTEGGKLKFRGNWLYDPKTPDGQKNAEKIAKAIAAAELAEFGKTGVIEKFVDDPKRKQPMIGNKNLNNDGDVYTGYADMLYIKTLSDKRPKLFDRDKTEVDPTELETLFKSGYWFDVNVSFYCTSKKEAGGKGLFCGMNGIRFRKKDETFGGGYESTGDDFDDVEDDEDDDML